MDTKIIPRIKPTHWDEAASLCASTIDINYKAAADAHPSFAPETPDGGWLALLREEFDWLETNWYSRDQADLGSEGDLSEVWWISLAATTMRTASDHFVWEEGALTAHSVLPLLRSKQEDYGYENINRFGRVGLIVRIHDKIARIENLVEKGSLPINESLKDSFVDLVGYCIIALMVEHDIWNLPLRPQDSVIA
jgi:hypothetical protein